MYDETKKAVNKAFDIGKILFSLGTQKYNDLLQETKKINLPQPEELIERVKSGERPQTVLIEELRNRYIQAARRVELSEKYGIAMLEYAAMLKEIRND